MLIATRKQWDEKHPSESPDFVLLTSEALVDHPSFGHAIIARLIENEGFSVAILTQPQSNKDYLEYPSPKHAFFIAAGTVDSMVRNYTVSKNKRDKDYYSDEGKIGHCPDRVTISYCKKLRELYPNAAIIAGGIEPSLRRLAHYDYHDNAVHKAITATAQADLIIYGMGESQVLQLLFYAKKGIPLSKVRDIEGTAYLTTADKAAKSVKEAILNGTNEKFIVLPSFNSVSTSKKAYLNAFVQSINQKNKGFIQKQSDSTYAVVNPPAKPLSTKQLDSIYELPFTRKAHPKYKSVPSIEEVQFSITAHRGCFGGCNFCALSFHQGNKIVCRSEESIIKEAEFIIGMDNFKGYIHDVGGPTANFHVESCKSEACQKNSCIGKSVCKNLAVDHSKYLSVLQRLRRLKGVKKVFIRSGIRYDYLMLDKNKDFFNEIVKHHISGQLKVAPEHCGSYTLNLMNKPNFSVYEKFKQEFEAQTKKAGLKQYLVPYFMSSHPGTTIKDAIKLLEYLLKINYSPEQVQDFYPTPSTMSTTMYYTELNPITNEKIFVAKAKEEKAAQRILLQFKIKKNLPTIKKILLENKRQDLWRIIYHKSANSKK